MASPVKPSHVQETIILPTDTICQALVKLIRVSVLIWKFLKYRYKSDGTISDDFQNELCAVVCPETE